MLKDMVSEIIALKFQDIDGVKVKALKNRLKQHGRTRITPEDMRRLCQTPDAATLVGMRDRALLATLASSGLRASELANLTSGQIRLDRNNSDFPQVRPLCCPER